MAANKKHPNYNVAIGAALGIEGSELSGPDYGILKPLLTLELSGGLVMVRWGWQGYAEFLDLIELCVNRGAGFVTLTYDSTPDYLDTTPIPATPARWIYKGIYRVGDNRVGQWSDETGINIGG